MKSLLPILWTLLAVSCAGGFVLFGMLISRLRSRHSPTWESLGRPTLLLNNSIANSVALLGFLWRREYLALGDQEFTRLADFLRCFLAGYLVLLLITLAIFVTTIQLDREHGATSSSRGPGC